MFYPDTNSYKVQTVRCGACGTEHPLGGLHWCSHRSLTEEDVRRIVREELIRHNVVIDRSDDI
jgi:hypothetical protein